MTIEKLAGVYVYCMDYHEGQGSRLYRLMSRIARLKIHLTDNAVHEIRGYLDDTEWYEAQKVYSTLKERKAR